MTNNVDRVIVRSPNGKTTMVVDRWKADKAVLLGLVRQDACGQYHRVAPASVHQVMTVTPMAEPANGQLFGQVKVWVANANHSRFVDRTVAEHMVQVRIATKNFTGQIRLVDGWSLDEAVRYVINGDS